MSFLVRGAGQNNFPEPFSKPHLHHREDSSYPVWSRFDTVVSGFMSSFGFIAKATIVHFSLCGCSELRGQPEARRCTSLLEVFPGERPPDGAWVEVTAEVRVLSSLGLIVSGT